MTKVLSTKKFGKKEAQSDEESDDDLKKKDTK